MALIQVDFYSDTLRKIVPFTALIPNDPREEQVQPAEGYPALYLLHGFTGNCTDWVTNTRIAELSSKYEIAVIMPSGENSFYVDDGEMYALYGKFIGEELIDYTRRLFRLSEKRENTAIAGLSMGGYGAMRNGLKYADRFSAIMSYSGAFIEQMIIDNGILTDDEVTSAVYKRRVFGDPLELSESDKNPAFLVKQLAEKGIPALRIFMTCGTEDALVEVNRKTMDMLAAAGLDVTYLEDSGEHNWDYWNKYLETSLQWLMKK